MKIYQVEERYESAFSDHDAKYLLAAENESQAREAAENKVGAKKPHLNGRISDLVGSPSTNTKAVWIHGVCCGASVERVTGGGGAGAGNVPCTLGSGSDSNSGGAIGPLACTGPGAGKNNVAIVQSTAGSAPAHYRDIYMEVSGSDLTTAACTIAAITLPVAYADTNYRLSVMCLGPTQFPQVQTVTKSNSTFTITLNNLTRLRLAVHSMFRRYTTRASEKTGDER